MRSHSGQFSLIPGKGEVLLIVQKTGVLEHLFLTVEFKHGQVSKNYVQQYLTFNNGVKELLNRPSHLGRFGAQDPVPGYYEGQVLENTEGTIRMQRNSSRAGFETEAKYRQCRFRNASPTISDHARWPTDATGRRNHHLLSLGSGEENLFPGIRGTGGAIDFFCKRRIKWWKGGDGRTDGPTRNMTSSQVACVNFLLPLAGIPGALLSVLRTLDSDVRDVVPIRHEERASPVEFEWIGLGSSLEGGHTRGAHNTSVDAFLVAETRAGNRRAYLLEWKYCERYLSGKPRDLGAGESGQRRRNTYASLFGAPYSSFDSASAEDLDGFLYEPFYQIMRQMLLADRMVHERELDVDEAKVVVVVPEDNWPYRTVADGSTTTSPLLAQRFPHLGTVKEVMRACLKDLRSQFDLAVPQTLLDNVVKNLPNETVEWAGYWRERYGV